MKKLLIFGLLILAVVLVAACAPPGSNGESGAFAGQAIGQIQANSGDRDATCEMRSAKISGAAYIDSAKIGSSAQDP